MDVDGRTNPHGQSPSVFTEGAASTSPRLGRSGDDRRALLA
jgi:hypothetical protein